MELEKITANTCSLKLQVMKMAYIPTELEKCRGCKNYENNRECEQFKPYNFAFPVRQGRLAYG